jgi:hypothetical protein
MWSRVRFPHPALSVWPLSWDDVLGTSKGSRADPAMNQRCISRRKATGRPTVRHQRGRWSCGSRVWQSAIPEADAAERSRRQAATLQTLDRLLDLYAYTRANESAGHHRTRAMDEVARRMQVEAGTTEFDPPEVGTWFRDGNDALRVVALNVMIARPECQELLAALVAIDQPRSLFEQYYGLRLAYSMAPRLEALDRELLIQAVRRAQRGRRFRRDPSLPPLADALLRTLQTADR